MLKTLLGAMLMLAQLAQAQTPAVKEVKGYVVAMDETKLVVSNVKVGGAGQTFVMPTPKDGAEPNWVAAAPATSGAAGDKPKMVMRTTGDSRSALKLTELTYIKGAFKAEEFPVGTEVLASYEDSSKTLRKLERVKPPQ